MIEIYQTKSYKKNSDLKLELNYSITLECQAMTDIDVIKRNSSDIDVKNYLGSIVTVEDG